MPRRHTRRRGGQGFSNVSPPKDESYSGTPIGLLARNDPSASKSFPVKGQDTEAFEKNSKGLFDSAGLNASPSAGPAPGMSVAQFSKKGEGAYEKATRGQGRRKSRKSKKAKRRGGNGISNEPGPQNIHEAPGSSPGLSNEPGSQQNIHEPSGSSRRRKSKKGGRRSRKH